MNDLVLEWPCRQCGAILSEVEFLITRKYCRKCAKERNRTRSNRHRVVTPVGKKLAYLLRTNRMATLGEMISYCESTRNTVITTMSELRRNGHQIKFCKLDGFYHYGGIRRCA